MKFTLKAIQGDLMIIKLDKGIPKTAIKRPNNVLVEGETTGHAHRLSEGEVYDHQDRIIFTAPVGANIYHEEHDIYEIPETGDYEIIRQRQKTSRDMTQLVVD